MATVPELSAQIEARFGELVLRSTIACGELTIEVAPPHLREVCFALRDDEAFNFKLLIDLCGVDYQDYGITEWATESTTATGFERGVEREKARAPEKEHWGKARFASVYHLLSLHQNHRLRVKVLLEEAHLKVPTVIDIWPAADWYEREAFDLFGIVYTGHPDLRRILTDYGFIGHPFRKDFPLIGNVEARYDATAKRVVYGPVSIQPRILEPKVIRDDNRYKIGE